MGALQAAPSIAATNPPYILVDADSGQILTSRDAHQLWHPASITKLMTAYLVFQALQNGEIKPESVVKISARALAEPPSKMGFPVGTTMTIDSAVKMMLVHSSNDISVALAETLGGNVDAFVARMNAQALKLGMPSTHYENPNGLPNDKQVTTARDLAVLSRAIWRDFPAHREIFSIPAIKTGKRVLTSYNPLLDRYTGTNGLKTGFICSSGYNLAASATRGGKTMIAVVLGATSSNERAELAAKLLDRGFNGINMFKQDLATTREASPLPEPVNMRDEVCNAKKKAPAEVGEAMATTSYLGPKVKLGDPVIVTTLSTPPVDKSKVAAKPAKATKTAVAKASVMDAADAKPAAATAAKKPASDKPAAKDAKPAVVKAAATETKAEAVPTKPPVPKFNSAFAPAN